MDDGQQGDEEMVQEVQYPTMTEVEIACNPLAVGALVMPDLDEHAIREEALKLGLDPQQAADGIRKELQGLLDQNVYEEKEASECPPGTRVIGTTSVLVPKADKVKGRICAQDFAYDSRPDCFAPTPSLAGLKIILVLMMRFGLQVLPSPLNLGKRFIAFSGVVSSMKT